MAMDLLNFALIPRGTISAAFTGVQDMKKRCGMETISDNRI